MTADQLDKDARGDTVDRKEIERSTLKANPNDPFDQDELVLLDREAEGGIRRLDRQVFGLSMNDVFEYLMDTRPTSSVIKDLIDRGLDEDVAKYVYQSADVDEEEAERRLELRRKVAAKLREGAEG